MLILLMVENWSLRHSNLRSQIMGEDSL
jgi:hypothetical protein